MGSTMNEVDKRLVHAFVLLGRQFLITEHVVRKRKPNVLSAFERSINNGKQNIQDVLRVYELAFSIVDNIVRYKKIASMLPRFSQKSEEYQRFAERLSGMTELRNLLQHIQGDIDTEFESPILGGVTWVKGKFNYMAAFHDVGVKKTLPGLVYDTRNGKFTKDFCYVHNGVYYDLSRAIAGYRGYQRYVEAKCNVQIDGKPYKIDEHYVALKMGILSAEEAAQQGIEPDAHSGAG